MFVFQFQECSDTDSKLIDLSTLIPLDESSLADPAAIATELLSVSGRSGISSSMARTKTWVWHHAHSPALYVFPGARGVAGPAHARCLGQFRRRSGRRKWVAATCNGEYFAVCEM